jgi:hypothetical protein
MLRPDPFIPVIPGKGKKQDLTPSSPNPTPPNGLAMKLASSKFLYFTT